MNGVPARLIVKRGPDPGQEYILAPVETTIGRSSTNDISIVDPEVSRRHACIKREGHRYIIEDWTSTNGTYVNGRQISGIVALNDGDEIRFGETILLRFLSSFAPENLPPRTPPSTSDSTATETLLEAVPPAWSAVAQQDNPSSDPAQPLPSDEFVLPEDNQPARRARHLLLGCGCAFFLLACLCAGSLFFLDGYQQGRLLYCGPIRPFFEIFLGPVGFAPICPI